MNASTSGITINAPAHQVWRALTEPELVRQWQYGAELNTDWQPGSPIRFRNEWQDQVFEQWGTILSFDPEKTVAYSLFAPRPGLEDKPENYFTMRYDLKEIDGSTRLSITQEDPREQSANNEDNEAGQQILQGLKELVEGLPEAA